MPPTWSLKQRLSIWLRTQPTANYYVTFFKDFRIYTVILMLTPFYSVANKKCTCRQLVRQCRATAFMEVE